MRDFYPENMRRLNYIFSTWKKIAEKYNFEEFEAPVLEPIDLWTAKSGEEIPEQMYRFKDKGGRDIALRPEITPSLARMVAQKQLSLSKPIKWYSIPKCWRYEAPQSGRLREFFQLNVDILGTERIEADAEIISTAIAIMKEFGCTEKDFFVRISNRRLINSLLKPIVKDNSKEVTRIIDKVDKISKEEFEKELMKAGLKKENITSIRKIIGVESLKDINKKILDEEGLKGYEEVEKLLTLLNSYGFGKYIKLDLSIMRGFDYYTGTVFEVFDKGKEARAIAGGGRYDDLVKEFGGEKCPGIGYGMGDVVLGIFLEKLKKFPKLEKDVDYYIAPINEQSSPFAIEVAQKLRQKYSVEIDLIGRSFSKQLSYANSINAKNLIVIGEKEVKSRKFNIKDLKSGKEEAVSFDNFKV